MKKPILFFLLSILLIPTSRAQEGPIVALKEKGNYYKSIQFKVKKNTFYARIVPQFKASSLSVEFPQSSDVTKSYLLLGGTERQNIQIDLEQSRQVQEVAGRNEAASTPLIISKDTFDYFSFYSGEMEGEIRIHLLYAKPLKASYLNDSKKKVKIVPASKNL